MAIFRGILLLLIFLAVLSPSSRALDFSGDRNNAHDRYVDDDFPWKLCFNTLDTAYSGLLDHALPRRAQADDDDTAANEPPARWSLLSSVSGDIGGDDEVEESTLRFRRDNFEVASFSNRTGHWHSFRRYAAVVPTDVPLGLGRLGFEFADIPRAGHANLRVVPFGRAHTVAADRVLATYDPDVTDDDTLRLALTTISLTLCHLLAPARLRSIPKSGAAAALRLEPCQVYSCVTLG